MIRLAITLTRAGGWPRMLLLGSCTAVVCALLLIVITFARLPHNPDEVLFTLVAEPGIRGGTAFATALLTLPPLLLLYQAVRLGTAARDRRLAALRLAGATPGEVRRLGALEVGIPAFVGSVGGIGLFLLLRQVLDGTVTIDEGGYAMAHSLKLIPTSVSPQWWDASLVVVATTLAGVFVGWRASRGVIVTPLGVSRRQASEPPRPWGLLLIVAAVLLVPVSLSLASASQMEGIPVVGLAVLGVVSLAPWAAYRAAKFAESRAKSAAMLLAARRLVADPRPAGRAAAAVGGIALVSGGASGLIADLMGANYVDSFFVISLALVGLALLAALLVVIGTLAVHSVESLLDRKRSVASLAALGMPLGELERAQRFEAGLVAMPMAIGGVILGSVAATSLIGDSAAGYLVVALNILLTPALVWLAIVAAVRLTRPWAVRAASPANLRTE